MPVWVTEEQKVKQKRYVMICAVVAAVILLLILLFSRMRSTGHKDDVADPVQTSEQSNAQTVTAGMGEESESIPSVVVEEDFEIVLEENEAVDGF